MAQARNRFFNAVLSLPLALTGITAFFESAGSVWAAEPPRYQAEAIGLLPNGVSLAARDINNAGVVVGAADVYSSNARVSLAFRWSHETGTQDLGSLLPGYSTEAFAINDQGTILGESMASDGSHGILWTSPGVTQDLEVHTFWQTSYSINNSGMVVGHTNWGSYLWQPSTGVVRFSSLPQGQGVSSYAINNLGQVAGTYTLDGQNTACVWSSQDGLTLLGALPDRPLSYAFALNDHGQIVGESKLPNATTERAFIWDAEAGIRDLMPGFSGYSTASDINNSGTVVGFRAAALGSDNSRAFVYMNGAAYDLNAYVDGLPASVTLGYAPCLNDLGQIVAGGSDGIAYVLTPVPEPASLAVLGLGLVGVLKRRCVARN